MATQPQRRQLRGIYAAEVAADDDRETKLLLELHRAWGRIEMLEGMVESLSAATIGSAESIREHMRSTRLPRPPELDEVPVSPE